MHSEYHNHPFIQIKRMKDILVFIIDETNILTKHFSGTQLDDNHIRSFCLIMIDRLNLACEGINYCLDRYIDNDKIEFTIGLTLRAVLLDYLITMYAHNELKEDKKAGKSNFDIGNKLNKYCQGYLSEGIQKTFNHMSLIKDEIDASEIAQINSALFYSNPNLFHPYNHDGTEPKLIYTSTLQNKQLFEKIRRSETFKKVSWVYHSYLYYSKYDHFGNMYYQLSRNHNVNKLQTMERAVKVLQAYMGSIVYIMLHVYPDDVVLKNLYLKLTEPIQDNPQTTDAA
jgi:hypothetical protein